MSGVHIPTLKIIDFVSGSESTPGGAYECRPLTNFMPLGIFLYPLNLRFEEGIEREQWHNMSSRICINSELAFAWIDS